MNCAQQAQLQAIISGLLVMLNISAIVSFYVWRRARAPFRTAMFVVFVISALIVFDFFVLAIVPAPADPHPHPCP